MGLGNASLSHSLLGPLLLTAPSFGAGTFQSHSSGAAAVMPLSKADPTAGGGTLLWGQGSRGAKGIQGQTGSFLPEYSGYTPEEMHSGVRAGF